MDLLAALTGPRVSQPTDAEVSGLAYDSRRVKPGDLFFALPGQRHDGTVFVAGALERGAVAVVSEAPVEAQSRTVVQVVDARRALAEAACRFHGYPSRSLKVVAVTGTNGKTTTTYMLESIFRQAGLRAGLIGTTGIRIDGEGHPSAFTTPEAPELQAALATMRDRGIQAVAIEASSHALAQRRTHGLESDVCVFTNLTQDHLDFHGTMDAYLDAKLMLLDGRNGPSGKQATVIVNANDPSAARVIEAAKAGGMRTRTFGLVLEGVSSPADPDLLIEGVTAKPTGLELQMFVEAPGRLLGVMGHGTERIVTLPMLGRFNASNAAGAFGAARALEIEDEYIFRGLELFPGVPGRLERVAEGQPFQVVVDYAHTPDALERALDACREHTSGRVLLVFGCGGDRDRGKRPVMGGIAAAKSDIAWITNDNPRSEDPAAIAREVAAGDPSGRLRTVLDRREAIGEAIAAAGPKDIVVIAGKGHETTQTIGDRVLPFDDREVAREILRSRTGAGR